jgi:hypothetical protein
MLPVSSNTRWPHMMRRLVYQRKRYGLAPLFALLCLSTHAHAAESITYGGPRGGTDIGGAYLPATGGFYGFVLGYAANADSYYGNNARSSSALKLNGSPVLGGAGLIYVYPFKFAGGTLATSALETYAAVAHLCVNDVCRNSTGLGDLYSDILMWSRFLGTSGSNPQSLPYGLTMKVAMSMNFPTGKYSATSPVPTPGINLYRIIPNFALTYLTQPNALGDGLEISTQFFYGITPVNGATNYKSGDTIDIDFAVSERFGRWQAGVAGNYAVQLSDDKINGVAVPGGNRVGLVTLGPVASLAIPRWKSIVKIKVQLPVYTKNSAHLSAIVATLVRAF